MNESVKVAVSNDMISILELMLQASLLVQIVILLLILASLASWVVIFTKSSTLKNLRLESDNFDSEFWSGGELNGLYRRYTDEEAEPPLGMASIFVAGYREYNRLAGNGTVDRTELVDGVHRAMRVGLSREIETLESRLSFLATVGSTSPYVGLFGTVWGIMNSFRSLGTLQHVTVATVAPGISEALIATAMGLFAAIPAVIAYNRFSSNAESLIARYEVFVEEFLSIVNRQALGVNRRA
jgi:biopolymer transport protein TolQ